MKKSLMFFILVLMTLSVSSVALAQEDTTGTYTLAARIGRGAINFLQLSEDGERLAVGTSRGVWFYDANNLDKTPTRFSPESLRHFAIDSTFNQLAAVTHSGEIVVWNLANNNIIHTFIDTDFIPQRLAFDLTGTYLAAANGEIWRIWNLDSGQLMLEGSPADTFRDIGVGRLGFSVDGETLGMSGDYVSREVHTFNAFYLFYDTGTGDLIHSIHLDDPNIWVDPFDSVLADDTTLLPHDARPRNEGIPTGLPILLLLLVDDPSIDGTRLVASFPHLDKITAQSISADNRRIAIAESNGLLRVWDIEVATGNPPCPYGDERLVNMSYFDDTLCDAALSALITESHAHRPQTLDDVFPTTIGDPSLMSNNEATYLSVDGQWSITIQAGNPNTIELSHEDRAILVLNMPFSLRINNMTISDRYLTITHPGNNYYDLYEAIIAVWDIRTDSNSAEPIAIFTSHGYEYITATALSPDGRRLVTSSEDGTARVWDLDTLSETAVLEHGQDVRMATFGEDGETILTLGDDGVIYVWTRTPASR